MRMFNRKLELGDVVKLRSGGADMTIVKIRWRFFKPIYECDWHDAKLEPCGVYYPECALIKQDLTINTRKE